MLFRILIVVFSFSFIFSAPKELSKNSKAFKNTNIKAKTTKSLKNFIPGPAKKDLTYKDVAIELQNSKNIKTRLTTLEQQAVVAFLDGKRKGGTYLKHLTRAMKKHNCYKGSNRIERLNKFKTWPTIKDNVEWFTLDCSVSGTPPINPKMKYRKNKSK